MYKRLFKAGSTALKSSAEKKWQDGNGESSRPDFLDGSWIDNEDLEVLYFVPKNDPRGGKWACFDMDQTIIKTKSGEESPENHLDLAIMFNGVVPKKLQELHQNKYRIVVFSNQRGQKRCRTKTNMKLKFTSVMERLGVPMMMFLSYGSGIYRKPCIGLWNLLEQENGPIDKEESFFVGDAAGRPENWEPGAPKDHSKVDRLSALNAGLDFHTPEEFFLKASKNKFEMPVFDPKTLRNNDALGVIHEPNGERREFRTMEDLICPYTDNEMLVFVGYPASGKSTLARLLADEKNYAHTSQDTLGSLEKCVKQAREELSDGKSVIIDNTNPVEDHRKRYIDVAKAAGVGARCFLVRLHFGAGSAQQQNSSFDVP